MRYIKLTNYFNKQDHWFNMSQMESFRRENGNAYTFLIPKQSSEDEEFYQVLETPEEILKLL